MWMKFGLSQTLFASSFQPALILVLLPLVCELLKGRVKVSVEYGQLACILHSYFLLFYYVIETRKLEFISLTPL